MPSGIEAGAVALRLRAVMADQQIETVGEFASYLGAERSQVSNWLQGYNLPPAHWMDELCRKRPGLTLDWIYRGVADALPVALAIKLEALAQGMVVPADQLSGRGAQQGGKAGKTAPSRKRKQDRAAT